MRKIYVALIVVFAFALLAMGCSAHVTGGGFVEGSADYGLVTGEFVDGDTANFGFNFKCDGTDAKGQLTYHDGDLKIKGTITSCEYGLGTVTVNGDFVPQGKSPGVEGVFEVTGSDGGEPGIGEDTFKIQLWGFGFFYYENEGDLLGGNIQEH
jgi:hypothetical protein